MKDSSHLFKSRSIAPGVTLIEGVACEYCYLVEGSRLALLIDTLTGVGDLRAYCERLTRLPLEVVNTHGHFDHTGGNFQFDGVRIHPADVRLMYQNCGLSRRFRFATGQTGPGHRPPWSMDDIVPVREIECRSIVGGEVLDLGGRRLELIDSPGHTRGSMCLLDRENGIFFAGDSCNTNTLLHFEESSSIEEYLSTLRKLKELGGAITTYLICHEDTPLDKSCIDDAIECCEAILDGSDDGEEAVAMGLPCRYAKARRRDGKRLDGRLGNVAYDPARKRAGTIRSDGP